MICAEMIRATYRLDELCPISANTKRPLLAESGPSKSPDFAHLNGRFGEKRTLRLEILKNGLRTAALRPEAAVGVESP